MIPKQLLHWCICLAVLLPICGCASFPAPVQTAEIPDKKPAAEISNALIGFANECWNYPVTPLRSGILIRVYRSEPTKIFVHRVNWKFGVHQGPFFMATIAKASEADESSIRLEEGPMICNFGTCTNLDLSSDVKRFLQGDSSCRSLTTSLLFG